MRRSKRLVLILFAFVPLGIGLGVVSPAFADDSQLFQTCQILAKENKDNKDFKPSPICADKNTTVNPVNHVLHVAADIIALLAGLAAVIIIIISGIRFITSGGAVPGQRAGDPNAVKSARTSITNAIIGLVIVALAWTIVSFATDKLIK